jgi:hypothetical protein
VGIDVALGDSASSWMALRSRSCRNISVLFCVGGGARLDSL